MRVAAALIILTLFAGCSDSAGPSTKPPPGCRSVPPDSIRWAEHDEPVCASNGNIAFNDQGFICAADGGFGFDRELGGLWVLDAADGQRRRILPLRSSTFTWSPAATHLLVAAGQLYFVEIATLSVQQLTTSGTHYSPSWSNDGLRIAFDDGLDLWCMNADGSDARKIAERGRSPSWCPDGTRIAYSKAVSPHFPSQAIFIINPDGTQNRRLVGAPTEALQPAFSPDGSQIAYTAQDIPGGAPQIWIMDADGSNARQVTRYGGAHPTWTPDGRRIIFGAPGGSCGSTDVGVLWSVDVETGDQVQVTTAWPQRPEECSAALPGGRRSVARTARDSSAWSVPAKWAQRGIAGWAVKQLAFPPDSLPVGRADCYSLRASKQTRVRRRGLGRPSSQARRGAHGHTTGAGPRRGRCSPGGVSWWSLGGVDPRKSWVGCV